MVDDDDGVEDVHTWWEAALDRGVIHSEGVETGGTHDHLVDRARSIYSDMLPCSDVCSSTGISHLHRVHHPVIDSPRR